MRPSNRRNFKILVLFGFGGAISLNPWTSLQANEGSAQRSDARYVGAIDCSTSGCHGGAAPIHCQYTIWSQHDIHARSYATLTTAYSARISESLTPSVSATENPRCTVCHAPFSESNVPPPNLAPTAKVTEGVSCEACHGAAGNWWRSHTRMDWNHADRIHAGMADLDSAYNRAETCAKCHQVIDPALVSAGHPSLIFELDGQSASEPRHWKDKDIWFGPKAWLVGQAVALRDMATSSASSGAPDDNSKAAALAWVLQRIPGLSASSQSAVDPAQLASWSDSLAKSVSEQAWNQDMSLKGLQALAATSESFKDEKVSVTELKLRAERLVLGLDRLSKSLATEDDSSGPGRPQIDALFAEVQDPDPKKFDTQKFADLLQKLADALNAKA